MEASASSVNAACHRGYHANRVEADGRPPGAKAPGGKSGLRRAGRWVTPSRGDPKESATEITPPSAIVSGEPLSARVKWWGKSPPAAG